MAFTDRAVGLARAAITAVGAVIDTAVRALTAAWARAWDALAGAFTAALEALLGRVEGEWPPRRTIEQDAELQGVLADAVRALDALADLAARETTGAVDQVISRAADDQARIINAQLPPDSRQVAARVGFHQRAIDAIRARVRQRIISLTRPLSRDADTAMRRELVRGVQVGANPRETARRMVARVEGAFNGGLTRALVIARTETLDAYRQAAAAVQEEHRDVLAGWVWLARLDERSCPACWVMHGTVHRLDEPGPLGHPQCRCSRAPQTLSWRELGFDVDEPADAIPDGEAVFRQLPRAEQVRIMGPARLELLDRGAVTWRDLARLRNNPGWRPSITTTPVKDLAPAG